MIDESKNTEALRRLIEEILLHDAPESVPDVFSKLVSKCESKDITFNPEAALEYWWHLARLGVVAVPGAWLNEQICTMGPSLRRLIIPERGRTLLERGERSPHDPQRYFNAVRTRVEAPDDIVMTYLDEAVGAWAAGLYRSSAVMLGCACERLVIILAEAIVRANLSSWSAKIESALQGTLLSTSQLFELIRQCLIQLRSERKLLGKLGNTLDRKLSPIFDHARGLRNESGHPTGTEISAEDAEAGLLLFPGFYALVSDLCRGITD